VEVHVGHGFPVHPGLRLGRRRHAATANVSTDGGSRTAVMIAVIVGRTDTVERANTIPVA
jgi:hypothetical protein